MASQGAYDHLLKFLLVGDAAVGKTSLLLRFTQGSFADDTRSTVGVDVKVKTINFQKKQLKLTIWDTAGQEKFRTVTSSYYRGANAIILVYDISQRSTFENISEWLKEIDIYNTNDDVVKMLVGNKLDLESTRAITTDEGRAFARKHSMLFIECSAKTQQGVQDAFLEVVQKILDSPPFSGDGAGGDGLGGGAEEKKRNSVKVSYEDGEGGDNGGNRGICC